MNNHGGFHTQTEYVKINPAQIDSEAVGRAAAILRAGGVVAIPTETVYGLAANALDSKAVSKIFKAKGRPEDNPLIVHICRIDWLQKYAVSVPESAYRLAEAFWPGPLTMLLKKNPMIPHNVTAGLDSVGIRFPSHPVAQAVIRAAGVPLAAPSANLSGSPSPTRAAHVMDDMDGRIDMIVDGGECSVGVESTVLSLCSGVPRILRPGGVTAEQIASVLGNVEIDSAVTHRLAEGVRPASPGMKYRHYAPKARVIILNGGLEKFAAYVKEHASAEEGYAVLCYEGEQGLFQVPAVFCGKAGDSAAQARCLFDALRHLDEIGARVVYARCPEKTGVGLAVYNRLLRAAGFEIIDL